MRFWYDKDFDDQNDVNIIAIRCISCGKETGLSTNNMNTKYKDTTTSFVLNTLLHHVGMSQIIDTHEQLKYAMDKNSPSLMTGGPWYNISI